MHFSTKEIFGDVRYNAVFFMIGVFALGLSFAFTLLSSAMPYAQGGPVASLAGEYALIYTLAAALAGVGFIALGLGALVFSQNYEPIKQEAQLITFSAIPYGIFLISMHLARVRAGGLNDYFGYAVARSPQGTPTIIVAAPESLTSVGPFLALGSFAALVFSFGLAQFLGNMKIVKEVGGVTLLLTRMLGVFIFAGNLCMLLGWSAFASEATGADWLGAPFILYFVGYLMIAFAVPVVGLLVTYRVGSVFWDAAKTVRYLSDFRKKAAAVADHKARTEVDKRPWWERIADSGDEKE